MQVRLYIRIRLATGKRIYAQPGYAANGRIKPFYAVIDGKLEHHLEGVYQLRYVKGGKRIWESVGTDAQAAIASQLKKESALAARAAGVVVVDDEVGAPSGRDLAAAIAEYIAEVKAAKAKSTYIAYEDTLRRFSQCCSKKTLKALDRADVLQYIGVLRDEDMSARTVSNHLTHLKTFFLHFELKWPLLKTDRVRYTQKTVEAYNTEQLSRLFAACDRDETDLFRFLVCTGVREQEAVHATWTDIDFTQKKFYVREKRDHLVFTPKDKEERAIPIPDALVELLLARRKRLPNSRLIFPGPDGKTDQHFLRVLQNLAFRAGLNCGECFNKKGQCCSDHAMCHRWGLHRFRKTFATMHHEAGVAPRIDMVALEPCDGRWRVVLWEAKLVGDGRLRCRGSALPKVVGQLKHYSDWLSDPERAKRVTSAYQNNCRLLVELHAIAKRIRSDLEELGPGIRAVAATDAPSLTIDPNPRLLIIYDKTGRSFEENGHADKLRGAGVPLRIVKKLDDVALCGLR